MVCRVIEISITGVLLKKPPKSHTIKYNKKCDLTPLTPSLCSLVLVFHIRVVVSYQKQKPAKSTDFDKGTGQNLAAFDLPQSEFWRSLVKITKITHHLSLAVTQLIQHVLMFHTCHRFCIRVTELRLKLLQGLFAFYHNGKFLLELVAFLFQLSYRGGLMRVSRCPLSVDVPRILS